MSLIWIAIFIFVEIMYLINIVIGWFLQKLQELLDLFNTKGIVILRIFIIINVVLTFISIILHAKIVVLMVALFLFIIAHLFISLLVLWRIFMLSIILIYSVIMFMIIQTIFSFNRIFSSSSSVIAFVLRFSITLTTLILQFSFLLHN